MENILELIKNYGLPLVFLIGLLFWLKKYVDRMLNLVLAKAEATAPQCEPDRNKLTDTSMARNKALIEAMRKLRETLHADRAYIFLYHNGTESGNYHFRKSSNIIESCKPGISSQILHLQNIPICAMWAWASKIYEKEVIRYDDIDDLSAEASSAYMILKEQGIKSILCYGIYDDATKQARGFIGVDYLGKRHILDEDVEEIIRYAGKIEVILSKASIAEFNKCRECSNVTCKQHKTKWSA